MPRGWGPPYCAVQELLLFKVSCLVKIPEPGLKFAINFGTRCHFHDYFVNLG